MSTLTLQEKLALSMTSAVSQRSLAKLLGITHQKLGRWLREGQEGGIKSIPKDAAPVINAAFALHSEVSRQQAKVDHLPYLSSTPVFINRPTLKNGQPGERVYIESTQYIRRDLRMRILGGLQRTQKFLAASVRSTVDLYSYTGASKSKGERDLEKRFTKFGEGSIGQSYRFRESVSPGKGYQAPIFTRYENIMPGTEVARSMSGIEMKIRQKHEPHAIALADQFLLQTITGQYEKQSPQNRATAKPRATKRSRITGRK